MTAGARTRHKRVLAGLAAASALVLTACGAGAQDGGSNGTTTGSCEGKYLEAGGPVTLTVTAEAGGGTDMMARGVAEVIKEVRPEATFQVVNRPGAGGVVGYTSMLQHTGDPLQLVALNSGVVTAPRSTGADWSYENFTPIGHVAAHVASVSAGPGKFADFADLVDTLEAGKTHLERFAAAAEKARS